MKEIVERKKFNFLEAIHGENIPPNLKKKVLPSGVIVYSDGVPDIKKIIKMTLSLMR